MDRIQIDSSKYGHQSWQNKVKQPKEVNYDREESIFRWNQHEMFTIFFHLEKTSLIMLEIRMVTKKLRKTQHFRQRCILNMAIALKPL